MWKLIFNGEVATGFQRQEVVDNLAVLLKTTPSDIARNFFNGSTVSVKEVEEQQEAIQWRRDFAKAGALLIVEPSENELGGSPYAGADPANTHIEEPTPTSLVARLTGVRRRNQAFMVLGTIALMLAVVIAFISKVTMS